MNKVAIVTGASSGIGFATAQELIKQGYQVYSFSRTTPNDDRINHVVCDVTDRESVETAFKTVFDKTQQIDVVINNAGMGISGPIELEPQEDIDKIINVNFGGVAKVCAVAMPYLRDSKGYLLNVSSFASEFPIPFQALYSATKAGVQNLSLALSNEVKPYGVKVSCILPGDIKTSFTKNRIKAKVISNQVYGARVERSISKMEADEQNGMSPDKIANAIAKVVKRKNPPLVFTVGFKYKLFRFIKRGFTSKMLNKILYLMYAK